MRKAFNKELLSIAKRDPRVFMILADIGYGEIEEFAETFPDRFINCGVAEQNMTGVACGVAMEGSLSLILLFRSRIPSPTSRHCVVWSRFATMSATMTPT